MQLNKIALEERTEKALRLSARVKDLHEEIKRFVGEANLGYDEGITEVRRIASEGIIKATLCLIDQEKESKT